MRFTIVVIALACLVAVATSTRPSYIGADETLVFEDDFNSLNVRRWKHEITASGGGNWEFEYYTNNRSNSFVKDGKLHLRATLTSDKIGEANVENGYIMDLWGSEPSNRCTAGVDYGCFRQSNSQGMQRSIVNPVQSARISTQDSFSFKYGRVEFRAKTPSGQWLWPALWAMPIDGAYGNWPASGEIDIMESRGNSPPYPEGSNTISSAMHWGPHWPLDPYELTFGAKQVANDPTSNFHTYGLYWNKNHIYTYIDDPSNKIMNVPINESFWKLGGWDSSNYDNPWANGDLSAPFDQEFYLIMNLAVGGVNFFSDGPEKPWRNDSPVAMSEFWEARGQWYPTWVRPELVIDSVKVWTFPDSTVTQSARGH